MLYDQEMGFSRGVNASIHPMRLSRDAMERGVNLSLDSTIAKTRPAFSNLATLVSEGTWQGSAIYHLSGVDHLIFVVDGVVYSHNTDTAVTTAVTEAVLSTGNVMMHFCQAERYMVIQDGATTTSWEDTKWPVILDGLDLVDQSEFEQFKRLPKGKQMAYGHGRLFVATSYIYLDSGSWTANLGNVGFVAGDLIKSKDPLEILNFTEEDYLNGGGRIIMPQEIGKIQGMTIFRNNPTGTGQGPLIVSAEHGWSAYQVDADRGQWFTIELGTVLFSGRDLGCIGEYSFDHATNGLVYMSKNGLRLVHDTSAKAFSGSLSNNPISAEVADLLSLSLPVNTPSVASAVSRVFMTGNADVDDYYRSLVVLNTNQYGSITSEDIPIYEGEWTGLNFLQVIGGSNFSSNNGVYIVARSDSGAIKLYEPVDSDPDIERPTCQIFTRYYDFEKPLTSKMLDQVYLNFFDIDGLLEIKVYYRSGGSSLWGTSRRFTVDAQGEKQHIKDLCIPIENAIDKTTNGALATGFRFQLCIEWTGVASLGSYRLVADKATITETTVTDSGRSGVLAPTNNLVDITRYNYEVTE